MNLLQIKVLFDNNLFNSTRKIEKIIIFTHDELYKVRHVFTANKFILKYQKFIQEAKYVIFPEGIVFILRAILTNTARKTEYMT